MNSGVYALGSTTVGVSRFTSVRAFLSFVFLNAAITLVDRNTDLVNLLAVNRHRLDPFGDESLGDVVASRAGNLHLVAALNAQLVSQFHRNLDERLRE